MGWQFNPFTGTFENVGGSGGGVSLSGNNTWTGRQTFNAGIALGGNISAASWGLTGIKLIGGGSTLTDTSAAGTVASGATDVLGGNTISATNARTLTNYYSAYFKDPVAGTNVTFTNKWSLGLEGGLNIGGNARLWGTVANTLDIRNSTNANAFKVANTWTDAANNEYGVFDWISSANVLTIGTTKAGTGSTRNLQFVVGGVNKLDYGITASGVWTFANNINLPASPAIQANGASFITNNGTTTRIWNSGNTSTFDFNSTSGVISGSPSTITINPGAGSFSYVFSNTGWVKFGAVAFGSLPAAATAGAGARMSITDGAASPTFGAAAAGGGSLYTPVYSDGTTWRNG